MTERDELVRIVDYDPAWTRVFEEERLILSSVLAPWLAGPIEHIGSTAVPGLAAKPTVDIMAPVESLGVSREAIEAVARINYQYAPYHADVMHWFCKPHPSFRTHHLHLVPRQSALWEARIRFRDRLRADPGTAAAYSKLKERLAAAFAHNRDAYTAGKSEFIQRVLGDGEPPGQGGR